MPKPWGLLSVSWRSGVKCTHEPPSSSPLFAQHHQSTWVSLPTALMERLSDGRALKGKYALGQYCTVQNRKRCSGVENRIPVTQVICVVINILHMIVEVFRHLVERRESRKQGMVEVEAGAGW